MARLLVLIALSCAGCGGTVQVGAEDEEGASGSTGSSSTTENCHKCWWMGGSGFDPAKLCPGEETEMYERIIACACRVETCYVPGKCTYPGPELDLLCDGAWVSGPCSACLNEHCAEERVGCTSPPPF